MSDFIPISQPVLDGREREYILDCIDTAWISSAGQYIQRFESMNADFYGVSHGVAVSNGTVALHLALAALGIGPGDEVIVPDLTFAATANTVLHAGATPVLADVCPGSWTLDVARCEALVTGKTRAVIPVHLYGQPCDMDLVMAFAEKHNLYVIEDCAEAHGAEFNGKRVGGLGHVSCYSFYGNKIVTTGEGGICLTRDDELQNRLRILRDHGMNPHRRYWHDSVGYNYRMTNLQAAVGCAQMERIEAILKARDEIARRYDAALAGHPLMELQPSLADRRKVCWLYSVLLDASVDGHRVRAELKNRSIDSRPFFVPLHQMPPYASLKRNEMIHSPALYGRGLTLPTFSNMTSGQIDRVCEALLDILS